MELLFQWVDYGFGRIRLTLAQTDDVGVFCSPLSQEYSLAIEHFSLSVDDVQSLCSGAVDIIFGDEEEKERLRKIYEEWDGWTEI